MAKSNSAGKKPMGSGMQQTTLVARRSVVSPSNGSPKSDQLGLGGKKNGKKKKAPTHKKMCLTPRPGNPKTGCSNQPARMGPLVAHQRRLVPRVGARGAHRVCLVAQLGLLRARLCAAQEPLRRAADELAGRLRAGGADAQLQPTQRGVNLGVVGAGGAHVCARRNFQFSIKILFKIRGRRREIWGSK